jgi:ligand-binding sensor domain-containing protein
MERNNSSHRTLKSYLWLVLTTLFFPANDSFAASSTFITSPAFSQNDIGIPAKKFFAAAIDNNNNKWFLTELGIISFNGEKWTLHNNNIQGKDLRDIAFDDSTEGTGFWIATGSGITSLSAPVESNSGSSSFTTDNASILSNNVVKVVVGNNKVKWIGTEKGVSAYAGSKWLDISYDDLYPSMVFQEYPITSMATNPAGDSLYIGTKGAGVARIYKNDVDGISGASVYAQWGPIIIPSDNVYSVFIEKNGAKWFGTDMGVGQHTGNNTLENWVVYTTAEGLVNDYVQAIAADQKGQLWFGTQGGISVFDRNTFTNYTKDNGLNSNNILCLIVDKNGVVWIGTDDGVNSFTNGTFTSYK